MKLIVGLGNPGPKYALTRHNIGFLFIDALVESTGASRSYKSEFKGETQKIKIGDEPVIVLKPQTFMNLSGESVQPCLKFYNMSLDDLLVVHDEVDVAFGQMRFQRKRGHGGHNGIRNTHQMLSSDDYTRLRLGVGRSPVMPTDAWVLGNFSKEEMADMPDLLARGIDGVKLWMARGLGAASSEYNK